MAIERMVVHLVVVVVVDVCVVVFDVCCWRRLGCRNKVVESSSCRLRKRGRCDE